MYTHREALTHPMGDVRAQKKGASPPMAPMRTERGEEEGCEDLFVKPYLPLFLPSLPASLLFLPLLTRLPAPSPWQYVPLRALS